MCLQTVLWKYVGHFETGRIFWQLGGDNYKQFFSAISPYLRRCRDILFLCFCISKKASMRTKYDNLALTGSVVCPEVVPKHDKDKLLFSLYLFYSSIYVSEIWPTYASHLYLNFVLACTFRTVTNIFARWWWSQDIAKYGNMKVWSLDINYLLA
jgi:hypothetical protein